MEKTTQELIDEVFYQRDSRLHRAYFDSGHPDHHRVVEWFSGVVAQHLGSESEKPFAREVFPIVTKTGKTEGAEGEAAADPDDEINDFIDNFDFGGE